MNIPKELDKQENRAKALSYIKDVLFDLLLERYDTLNGLAHPRHHDESQHKLYKLDVEILERVQDANSFLYDYSKDWDLNHNDYEIN